LPKEIECVFEERKSPGFSLHLIQHARGKPVFQRQTDIEPFPSDSPDWEASPFREYSAAHGFDPGKQTSAGVRIAMLFDDRDNPNDAIRGWYALASYRHNFDGFLGGDSSWQQITADIRTYRAITSDKRHKLAFWAIGNFVTSGTAPYLVLPASGGDELGRSTRGYPEGRFRGEQQIYAEALDALEATDNPGQRRSLLFTVIRGWPGQQQDARLVADSAPRLLRINDAIDDKQNAAVLILIAKALPQ